jgi:segregation and condensation protein B
MSEESNKVEALLFSSGRKMNEEELSKITGIKPDRLKAALEELKRKHEGEDSPLILLNESDSWKLMTKEKYISLIQHIVTETELDKSLMETLAVIAWKYPILQADVIRLRNNKAYDHLRELEQAGFIAREKKGRTRSIRLTPKFFQYFDLPPGKAKTQDAFKELVPEDIRQKVEKTESDINTAEKETEDRARKKLEIEQKMRETKEKKNQEQEVDLVDEMGKPTKLKVYEQVHEENPFKGKLGIMETYGNETKENEEIPQKITESAVEQRVAEIEKEETSQEVEEEIEKILGHEIEAKKTENKKEKISEEEKEIMPEEDEEEEKEEFLTEGMKVARKILKEPEDETAEEEYSEDEEESGEENKKPEEQ